MSTLVPPIPLEDPNNQWMVDYIQDVASSPDFDYPPVCILIICNINRFNFSIFLTLQQQTNSNFTNTLKHYGETEVFRQHSNDPMNIN